MFITPKVRKPLSPVLIDCTDCKGKGVIKVNETVTCYQCGGASYVVGKHGTQKCFICKGEGELNIKSKECNSCNGKGKIRCEL